MNSIDFTQHEDYQQIVKTISEVIRDITSETEPFTEATDLTRDVHIDSASTMMLVFELEEKFDVSVPLNELILISTIGGLAELIVKLKTQS
jgi:acyl carrier protein